MPVAVGERHQDVKDSGLQRQEIVNSIHSGYILTTLRRTVRAEGWCRDQVQGKRAPRVNSTSCAPRNRYSTTPVQQVTRVAFTAGV